MRGAFFNAHLITDELPPQRPEQPPSPPPAYDEVTKQHQVDFPAPTAPGDVKIDLLSESPPEYAMAVAMSLREHHNDQVVCSKNNTSKMSGF